MLLPLSSRFLCPACRNACASLQPTIFRESADGHVIDGLLTCDGCGAWFPIQEELLELVLPPLLDEPALRRFVERFRSRLHVPVAPQTDAVATPHLAAHLT